MSGAAGKGNTPAALFPQVYDPTGKRVALLHTAYDAKITEDFFTASTGQEILDFNLPLSDPKTAYVLNEYTVLFGGSSFKIKLPTPSRDSQGSEVLAVHCEAQWYDLGGHGMFQPQVWTTPASTLSTVLSGSGWTVGNISGAAASGTLNVTSQASALAVIRAMPAAFGGELWFDNINRTVNLVSFRGSANTGLLYAYKKNLSSIQWQTDSTALVTRLYPYGNGGLDIYGINGNKEYLEDYSYYDSRGWPRQIKAVSVSNNTISDQAQLKNWGLAQLAAMNAPRLSFACGTVQLIGDTVPVLGDQITLWDKAQNVKRNTRVAHREFYPMQPERDVLVLETALWNFANAAALGVGSGTQAPTTIVTDALAPSAPGSVSLVTASAFDTQGNLQISASISWTAPTTNTDGTALTDLDHYIVQYKVDNGNWIPLGQTTLLSAATPTLGAVQSSVSGRVAAVDHAGNISTWATPASATNIAADNTGPNAPSLPTLSTALPLSITVAWNGLDSGAAQMPLDFARVEIHYSTTSGFTPSTATFIDFLTSRNGGTAAITQLTPGTTYYIKLVAYDRFGNASAASAQASATVAAMNGGTYIASASIGDAQIGSVSVGKLTAGTLNASTIIGTGKIATASSGSRAEMNSSGFFYYDTGGNALFSATASGVTVLGNIQSGSTIPQSMLGPSILPNGTFDGLDPTGFPNNWHDNWMSSANGPASGRVSGVNAYAYSEQSIPIGGSKSLSITTPADNTSYDAVYSDLIYVTPGDQLHLQLDISSVREQPVYARVHFYANSTGSVAVTGTPAVPSNPQWTSLSGGLISVPSTENGAGYVGMTRTMAVGGNAELGRLSGTVTVPGGAFFMRVVMIAWKRTGTLTNVNRMTFDNVVVERILVNRAVYGGIITGSKIIAPQIASTADVTQAPISIGYTFGGTVLLDLGHLYPEGWGTTADNWVGFYPRTVFSGGSTAIANNDSIAYLAGGTLTTADGTHSFAEIEMAGGIDPALANRPTLSLMHHYAKLQAQTFITLKTYDTSGTQLSNASNRGISLLSASGVFVTSGAGFDLVMYAAGTARLQSSAGEIRVLPGGGDLALILNSNNNNNSVGIACNPTDVNLHVCNSIDSAYTGINATAFNVQSDARTKTSVRDLDFDALDLVTNTPIRRWRYKDDPEHAPHRVGPMAQEMPDHLRYVSPAYGGVEMLDLGTQVHIAWAAVAKLEKRVRELEGAK